MTTAYPEAITFPKGRGTAPELAPVIDDTIKRFSGEIRGVQPPFALRFPPELEAVYEAETKKARVRELRVSQISAAIAIVVSTFSIPAIMPDLDSFAPEILAMGATIYAIPAFFFGQVSGRMREIMLFVSHIFYANLLISVLCLSRAPNATIGIFFSILGMMWGNTNTPLRFPYAVAFSLIGFIAFSIHLYFDPAVSLNVEGVLIFMAFSGLSATLMVNYRMERSARLGYLLASKEALRLFALNRDHAELTKLSGTDGLTGIPNRGHFDRRLAPLFDDITELGTEIHLIMLDVDFFKRFNDHYGHPAGDACLRAIAAALTRAVRGKNDFIFRYGGEEFGALLVNTPKAQAGKIAERIRACVQKAAIEHLNREDGLNVVTVSVGVAHAIIGDGSTPESLIERADRSLYVSKHGGRNQVSVSQ